MNNSRQTEDDLMRLSEALAEVLPEALLSETSAEVFSDAMAGAAAEIRRQADRKHAIKTLHFLNVRRLECVIFIIGKHASFLLWYARLYPSWRGALISMKDSSIVFVAENSCIISRER